MKLGLGLLVSVGFLASASIAAATPYYAAPAAMMAGNCSSPANACTVQTAATMATMSGDEVLLTSTGPYDLNPAAVSLFPGVTLRPQAAGTRPTLMSTNGNNVTIGSVGATVQDVTINVSGLGGSGRALDMQTAGTALRVQVIASGVNSIGVLVKDGSLLSDSTVQDASMNAVGIIFGGTGGQARNATVIATGTGSVGLNANGNFTLAGTNQVANVNNVIARGVATDLVAGSPDADTVTMNVDHSNFVTSIPPPPTAGVNFNDTGGNQSQAPLFANAALGDFTQLAGSPTIDTGAATGGLGPLDFSGDPRVLGFAPDIGADEFPSVGPTQFPNAVTTSTSTTKKKKCRKKKKKSKSAVTSKKKCKKKKKKK